MRSDPTRVVLRLEKDPRLVPAVGGAVHFQALQLGLDEQTCTNFSKASETFCRELLSQLPDSVNDLRVIVDRFQDRVEISVEHQNHAVPRWGGMRDYSRRNHEKLAAHVDQVLSTTEHDISRTTLVKFLHPRT